MKTRRVFAVERLESRETPSGALSLGATPSLARGIEDPNESSLLGLSSALVAPSRPAVAAFNPQPDPPTRGAIIAI